jgi:nitrogen fixation/metabolism regulation signal transduction histidine kinase
MPNEAPRIDRWEKEESRILLRDILYVILVLWISVFVAESFFLNEQSTPFDRIFGYIIVFIPLGTLNFLLHYLYRNRRIRRTGKLRSSLRYRLILAFLIVSIIPSLPIFLLTSGRVESVIGVFFDLDFRGAMESAEHMMSDWESEAARDFYNAIQKRRSAVVSIFLKDTGGKFGPELFDGLLRESYDAVYLVERSSPFLLYGPALKTGDMVPMLVQRGAVDDDYGVLTVDLRRFAFVSLTIRPEMQLVILKRLYPGRSEDELKYRQVNRLLNVEEARWEKVIPYSLRLSLAILYLGMIIADIIVAIVIARQISHPIVSLAAATRAVTEGKLDTRIELRAEGEIGILIDSFNSMTEELQTLRSRLLHSLRVGAWQEVARRLAHEIKNPLTPIQLSSERMLRKLDRSSRDDLVKVVRTGANTIIEQVNVLKHLLEEFSNFARLPSPRLELMQIGPLIHESVELFRNIPGVHIEVRVMDNLPDVWIDKTLFIGMMNNLVKNGIEAIYEKFPDGQEPSEKNGRIVISAVLHRQANRRFVLLKVEDNGPGIPEELRDRIFEPYFSTKGEHGSGLGLALVERAVLEHNARIYVSRSSAGGAEFRILFPEGKAA